MTPENIKHKKFRLCLQYHIKNCKGCCEGFIDENTYLGYISEVKQILNGNTQQISHMLQDEMNRLSAELKFEEAQQIKEK